MVGNGRIIHRVDRALKRPRGRDNAGLAYDGYSIVLLIMAIMGLPILMLEVRLSGTLTWSLGTGILLWGAFAARTAILTQRSPWGGRPRPGTPPERPAGSHEGGGEDVQRSD